MGLFKPAWMSNTLAIDDEYIGAHLKLLDRIETNRRLAKRKQTVNIGKTHISNRMDRFNKLNSRQT